jgi:hypothetical protein
VVAGALESKVAAIEANFQHTSEFHKGNNLRVLPVGTSFGPFNNDADRDVISVFITIFDKLHEVVPNFIEQLSVLLDFRFSVWVILVDRIPCCTSRTGD